MSHDFKAPPHDDVKQWQKVRALYEAGFTFNSCGCCGPGYRPAELRDVREFIESDRPVTDGEALLTKIQARVSSSGKATSR